MRDYKFYKTWWTLKAGRTFKLLYFFGSCRLYADNGYVSAKFRWWNPISLLFLVIGVAMCLFTPSTIKSTFLNLFFIKPYFKKNPSKLHWFNPFSDKTWSGKV